MSNVVRLSDKYPRSVVDSLRQIIEDHEKQNIKLESAVLLLGHSDKHFYYLLGEYSQLSTIGGLELVKRVVMSEFEP
jgi:hypothetical protein